MGKHITNATIFKLMEKWAPLTLAYDWDPVGLQIGSKKNKAKRIMITLDVLESVIDEAIEANVDLIIAHHPVLFGGINKIDTETPKGRIINKALKHDITVYASHTNLDIATGGVNDMLADAIEMEVTGNLVHRYDGNLVKLVVYLPVAFEQEVREALNNAGAGHIGKYSHCTFRTEGRGSFKPLSGTDPFIGVEGEVEYVNEIKLETIVKEADLSTVINKMKYAHPYEEVAYDIIPLQNKGDAFGLGRIGIVKNSMDLRQFSEYVKGKLDLPHVRVTGQMSKRIQKVAILGGSGEKYITHAKKIGADVFITGDVTFHAAQDAQEMGLAVIDAGHYIEQIMKEATKTYLEEKLQDQEVEILVSKTNTDPFQFM